MIGFTSFFICIVIFAGIDLNNRNDFKLRLVDAEKM